MDAYGQAFVAEAEARGYRDVELVDGTWCASADSCPDWARAAPGAAPGLRAIPGTDQMSIGRRVDAHLEEQN